MSIFIVRKSEKKVLHLVNIELKRPADLQIETLKSDSAATGKEN